MSDSDEKTQRPSWNFLNTRERRDSRREPIANIPVEIRLSAGSDDPDWAGSAVDINSTGIALVLPPDLHAGTHVYLSFDVGGESYSRLPGLIVRQERVGVGAVEFYELSTDDKTRLLSFLQHRSAPPKADD